MAPAPDTEIRNHANRLAVTVCRYYFRLGVDLCPRLSPFDRVQFEERQTRFGELDLRAEQTTFRERGLSNFSVEQDGASHFGVRHRRELAVARS